MRKSSLVEESWGVRGHQILRNLCKVAQRQPGGQAEILTASLTPLARNFPLLMIFTATLSQVLFSNASLTSPQAPLTQKRSHVSAYDIPPTRPAGTDEASTALLAPRGCCSPALRARHRPEPARKAFGS